MGELLQEKSKTMLGCSNRLGMRQHVVDWLCILKDASGDSQLPILGTVNGAKPTISDVFPLLSSPKRESDSLLMWRGMRLVRLSGWHNLRLVWWRRLCLSGGHWMWSCLQWAVVSTQS
jgi:hypothetical protein